MHRVGSRLELPSGEYRFRGAEVSRIAGKPTTGDQHPDAGVGAESVGDGVQLDADQLRRVTKAPVAVADIAGPALRVHLADPNEHVDVGVVRAVHQLTTGFPCTQRSWVRGAPVKHSTSARVASRLSSR